MVNMNIAVLACLKYIFPGTGGGVEPAECHFHMYTCF